MKHLSLYLILLVLGIVVTAQPHHRGKRDNDRQERVERHRHQRARLAESLDLNDEQKTKIEQLTQAHRSNTQEIRGQLDVKNAQLRLAIISDETDPSNLDQLVSEINRLRSEQFTSSIAHKLEIRSILDESQKMKFDEIHMERRKGHRGF